MEIMRDRFYEETKELFNKLGVKAILFDFDDTLIYTSEIFVSFKNEYFKKVSLETGLAQEIIEECLTRIDEEEYSKRGVNPNRWNAVVERMSEELPEHKDSFLNNLDILQQIYYKEPRMRSGVQAILEILKECGIKVGLVTHANVAWTERKLESSGLREYFEVVEIADENGHKGVECWTEAMIKMGMVPEECLVVGDSLSGDIMPSASLGARTIWIRNGSNWSGFKKGTLPEATVQLDDINQLLSAVAELR